MAENDIAATSTSPPMLWRRTSRRLISVEVIDRDYLLRRSHRYRASNAMVIDYLSFPAREGATPPDLDGPSPSKRRCCEQDQSEREEAYKCPVCLESVSQREPVSTRCGHVFCQDCLMAAIRTAPKCPLCNAKLKPHHFIRIYL